MDTPANVLQIVESFLRREGFDGLTHCDGECGCLVSDLAPCGEMRDTCEPGYRVPCECGDHDYHISTTPAPAPAAASEQEPQ